MKHECYRTAYQVDSIFRICDKTSGQHVLKEQVFEQQVVDASSQPMVNDVKHMVPDGPGTNGISPLFPHDTGLAEGLLTDFLYRSFVLTSTFGVGSALDVVMPDTAFLLASFRMAFLTCACVHSGCCSRYNAAIPATKGEAIEVPDFSLVAEVLPIHALRRFVPGLKNKQKENERYQLEQRNLCQLSRTRRRPHISQSWSNLPRRTLH